MTIISNRRKNGTTQPTTSAQPLRRSLGPLSIANELKHGAPNGAFPRLRMKPKENCWTNAIKGCADPQRAAHYFKLLADTSAGLS